MKQQPDHKGGLQERTMQLTRLKVEGYKSFKSLDVEMRPLNVLIGANGAGKSNFLSLFHLLREMAEGRFQQAVALGGGVDAMLHYGSKETKEFVVRFDRGKEYFESAWRTEQDDRLSLKFEVALFPDLRESTLFDLTPAGYFESFLKEPSRLLLKLSSPDNALVLRFMGIAEYLKNVHVYHLNDTGKGAPYKNQRGINDDFYLRSDGENLAAYLYKIKHKYPKNYERIRESIQLVAPYFDDFVLRPMSLNDHYIRLEWRELNSDYPFFAFQLPDGLIRFICLATLLQLPKEELPSLILIDEPELSLHPYALSLLASLIRTASEKTQVIIATQSVALLNEFAPEDVIVVERDGGTSVAKRLDATELKGWLKKYSLGELWESNVIGGRPR